MLVRKLLHTVTFTLLYYTTRALMQILCACLLRCSVLNVTVFLLQFSTTHCSCLSVCAECFPSYCIMYIVSNTCRVVNVMRKLHFKMSMNNRHFKTSLLGFSLFHLTYNSLLYPYMYSSVDWHGIITK